MEETNEKKTEEKKSEEKLGDMFFTGNIKVNKGEEPVRTEFQEKGVNSKFEQPWNIKFTLGSEAFINLTEFLSGIGYDVVFKFTKKELQIYILDTAKTHSALIVSKNIEFAEYVVKDLKDDEERIIFLDIEVIDELSINKELPIDFYVDTLINKTFYIVNGKEQIEKRLNDIRDESSGTLNASKTSHVTIKRWMSDERYQKIVITQGAMKNLMISLAKKYPKVKDNIKVCNVILRKNEMEVSLESDLKKNRIFINGQDLMVYPVREDTVGINLEYLVKFNKLKLNFQCNMYLSSIMPIIFECKYGGGNMVIYYTIAPYVPSSE